jgi:hypothetical protein
MAAYAVALTVLLSATAAAPPPPGCVIDLDCSLNGVCSSGLCACDPGWGGSACELLVLGAAPAGGAYGYGAPFATTSWGGNAILHPKSAGGDGLWHLFVTEIAGKGCGLHGWSSASTVRHATAAHPAGPYAPRDLALPHEAHNPQTVRIGDAWYIFHIGEALGGAEPPPCDERPPPHDADEFGRPIGALAGGSKIHRARSPNGPWLPLVRCLPANARAPSTSCGNALSRIVRVSSRASK